MNRETVTYEIEVGLRLFSVTVDVVFPESVYGGFAPMNQGPDMEQDEPIRYKILNIQEDDEQGNWHGVSEVAMDMEFFIALDSKIESDDHH